MILNWHLCHNTEVQNTNIFLLSLPHEDLIRRLPFNRMFQSGGGAYGRVTRTRWVRLVLIDRTSSGVFAPHAGTLPAALVDTPRRGCLFCGRLCRGHLRLFRRRMDSLFQGRFKTKPGGLPGHSNCCEIIDFSVLQTWYLSPQKWQNQMGYNGTHAEDYGRTGQRSNHLGPRR